MITKTWFLIAFLEKNNMIHFILKPLSSILTLVFLFQAINIGSLCDWSF